MYKRAASPALVADYTRLLCMFRPSRTDSTSRVRPVALAALSLSLSLSLFFFYLRVGVRAAELRALRARATESLCSHDEFTPALIAHVRISCIDAYARHARKVQRTGAPASYKLGAAFVLETERMFSRRIIQFY